MKKKFTFLLIVFCYLHSFASHISGGELFYEYLGPGSQPNTDKYRITMRLFRECSSTGQELNTERVTIGIYHATTKNLYRVLNLIKEWTSDQPPLIQNTPGAIPCLTGDGNVCFQVGTFSAEVELSQSPDGYILSWVRYSRQQLSNVSDDPYPLNSTGATFVTTMPGTDLLGTGINNSPRFVIKDSALVCAGKRFELDFSALDQDDDSLSYSFCEAYNGGSNSDPNPAPRELLSLVSLPYTSPYSGASPLGSEVSIDPVTGIISGTAPQLAGKYAVNVCVKEWRNGALLNIHRKDFILKVGDCDFTAAELKPSYITCDGFTLSFQNESASAGVNSYYWEFGDTTSADNISTLPTPVHTFKDSGTYSIKLVINQGEKCSDSTASLALVYPGFIPSFDVTGSCFFNPYQFSDLTTSKYGVVDSWRWDFGDASTASDSSHIQNPSYKYSSADSVDILLTVTNSKGCTDSVTKTLAINDKPTISLPFHDTLICISDSLQLQASSGSNNTTYTWAPLASISNATTPDPFVFPKSTTRYVVTVNDNGCVNADSVTVNVIPYVDLSLENDVTICRTDSIQLQPNTNALYFTWSPSEGLSDATAANPFAFPLETTGYKLIASVGKCTASASVNIKVVPYPQANAGSDTTICFGTTASLNGSMNGSYFTWSPPNSLSQPNVLNPIASPPATTAYILTVTDVLGCPKPAADTVIVNVIPRIPVFAGNDTTIIANQPLQLNATGGTVYTWSPSTGMDNANIPGPLVILGPEYDSITYKVTVSTAEGCSASDDMKVIVFKTRPDIFVPTAFTPNNDGLNDVLRAKAVGMQQFNYLKIFDRWGKLLFATGKPAQGWDGTYNGALQSSGTYVFMAQAVDYTGKIFNKKGTIVLIR